MSETGSAADLLREEIDRWDAFARAHTSYPRSDRPRKRLDRAIAAAIEEAELRTQKNMQRKCLDVVPTETARLLAFISNTKLFRSDIAVHYALALAAHADGDLLTSVEIDWCMVNDAIRKRWSMSGLEYIKARAWRIASP